MVHAADPSRRIAHLALINPPQDEESFQFKVEIFFLRSNAKHCVTKDGQVRTTPRVLRDASLRLAPQDEDEFEFKG